MSANSLWNDQEIRSLRFDPVNASGCTFEIDYITSLLSTSVEGAVGNGQLKVRFAEGIYTNTGSSGGLTPADFLITDLDDGRTILDVNHVAGGKLALLTLSSPLDDTNDLNIDTVSVQADSVFNAENIAVAQRDIAVTASTCPTGPVTFNLNEPAASTTVTDDTGTLTGTVQGSATLTGSEFSGNGSSNYINFADDTCLQASTAMTVEARFKPSGMEGSDEYITRILARDTTPEGGNYLLGLYRNYQAFAPTFNPPDGEASIVLWVIPYDQHGGSSYKAAFTNYSGAATNGESNCPMISDHWYQVKAVWNTDEPGGAPGQPFVPARIYLDDQGPNGDNAGELWPGMINCTDTDQSLQPAGSSRLLYTGDMIRITDGDFTIGTSSTNPNTRVFNGLIDWIQWSDSALYP